MRAPDEEAAELLSAILREESADVLLTYDRNGGYGHPDHVKVHRVGALAAQLAATPRVLQATVPRDTICRAVALAAKVYRFPPEFDRSAFERAFSPRAEITHRISVRRYAGAKRASMRAHASQSSADGGADRTLAAFLRIPRPLYDLVFGREWYVDAARPPGRPCCATCSRACREADPPAGQARRSDGPGAAGAGATGSEGVPRRRGLRARRIAQMVLGLALAAALLVWGLPFFAKTSWSDVFQVLGSISATTAAGLLLLVLVGLYSYTFTLTGSLHGLRHYQALIVNVCGSSVGNLLPGGGAAGLAVTYTICRSWGFSRRDISTSAIVTGVWNVLARVPCRSWRSSG